MPSMPSNTDVLVAGPFQETEAAMSCADIFSLSKPSDVGGVVWSHVRILVMLTGLCRMPRIELPVLKMSRDVSGHRHETAATLHR